MVGKYYLKHMINHKVNNCYKKKRREEAVKNYVLKQEEKERIEKLTPQQRAKEDDIVLAFVGAGLFLLLLFILKIISMFN